MESVNYLIEPITTSRVSSDHRFISSNTQPVKMSHLLNDCVIPVFARDNEPTISNYEFVEAIYESVLDVFDSENVLSPAIRVSHPIKGRIPEAKHKAAKELLDEEKTVYYERMMFTIEIPSIYRDINGNHLSLTVGGVRGYQQENLYARKNLQKFKVFVGFRNRVCCNMCVSTDGLLENLRVSDAESLKVQATKLLLGYESAETLNMYERWSKQSISSQEFAQFLGICRMLNHMPVEEQKSFPKLDFTDHQLNLVVDGYYNDKHFSRSANGSIDMWRLYNLFTSANKQSYIDRFLSRGLNASNVINNIYGYLD